MGGGSSCIAVPSFAYTVRLESRREGDLPVGLVCECPGDQQPLGLHLLQADLQLANGTKLMSGQIARQGEMQTLAMITKNKSH